jgi:hypothetical protein
MIKSKHYYVFERLPTAFIEMIKNLFIETETASVSLFILFIALSVRRFFRLFEINEFRYVPKLFRGKINIPSNFWNARICSVLKHCVTCIKYDKPSSKLKLTISYATQTRKKQLLKIPHIISIHKYIYIYICIRIQYSPFVYMKQNF